VAEGSPIVHRTVPKIFALNVKHIQEHLEFSPPRPESHDFLAYSRLPDAYLKVLFELSAVVIEDQVLLKPLGRCFGGMPDRLVEFVHRLEVLRRRLLF
jgi:hypothetical protein